MRVLVLVRTHFMNSNPRNIFLVKLLDNMNYIDGLGRIFPERLLTVAASTTDSGTTIK